MEIYKNWQISKTYYGFFEATNLDDCDSVMLFGKSVDELKLQIDERL